MITMTIIEKISLDITPIALPVAAKIRPTSPLGTIPQPMIALLTRPATKPATILPTKATKATTMASSSTGNQAFEPYLHARHHEEDGDKKITQRLDQILDVTPGKRIQHSGYSLFYIRSRSPDTFIYVIDHGRGIKMTEIDRLQNQPGGKAANNGGKADSFCEIGKKMTQN